MKRTLEKTLSKAHDSSEREASIARILQNVEEDNKKLLELLAEDDISSSPQRGRLNQSYNASTLSPTTGGPHIQKQFTKLPSDSPFAVKQTQLFRKYPQTPQKQPVSLNSDYKARMVALDSQYVKKQKAVEKAKTDTQYAQNYTYSKCHPFDCQTLI